MEVRSWFGKRAKTGQTGEFLSFFIFAGHDVRSREAVKTAFWNLAVSGKVSRFAEFGRVWAYSVGRAGAPKRAEPGFLTI